MINLFAVIDSVIVSRLRLFATRFFVLELDGLNDTFDEFIRIDLHSQRQLQALRRVVVHLRAGQLNLRNGWAV